MARTIEVKVYQYAELSDAAKTRAREWWRSGDLGHESWSQFVTADLKTIAPFMGWTITDTAFSGFSSQGDGAQFAGSWSASDVQDVTALGKHAPASGSERSTVLRNIMATVAALAKDAPDTSASVWGAGRYSHSMATQFDTPDLTNAQLETLATATRALMEWYYRELEIAYEYEMSDEHVAETIEANEYEFKANGDRFAG